MKRPGSGPVKHLPRPLLFIGLCLVCVLAGVGLGVAASQFLPGDNANNAPIIDIPGLTNHPGATPNTTYTLSPIPGQRTTPGTSQTPAGTAKANPAGSSLLFGTNISLFDANDQILTSPSARAILQQMHLSIIRMPTRTTLSEETMIEAAQIIKALGATPLIILQGKDITPDALDYDTKIINDMNSIFGKSIVYYEYGNEEDLLGVNMNKYTASWNALVPQLKQVALNGRFIGPVNYQYNRNYLQYFLQNAQPRADAISWHEYTCDDGWSADLCLSRIDNWSKHISDARAVMSATVGASLPIMITEWNFTPKVQSNDGKITNSAFMSSWTTKAIQTLAANHVFASMQYSCTNTPFALINGANALTPQGTTFQSLSQSMHTGQ